jgi:hypothetical protein
LQEDNKFLARGKDLEDFAGSKWCEEEDHRKKFGLSPTEEEKNYARSKAMQLAEVREKLEAGKEGGPPAETQLEELTFREMYRVKEEPAVEKKDRSGVGKGEGPAAESSSNGRTLTSRR